MISRFQLACGVAVLVNLCACSEPVPPASQGALIAQFQSGMSGMCRHKLHIGQIGGASATEITDLKKEGTAGARIFCSVTPAGGGFDIEGEMRLGNTAVVAKVGGMPTTATEDAPHPGTIEYRSTETINFYGPAEGTACDFWLADPVPGKAPQEVAAGRAWMQFKCERIYEPSTQSECRIAPGSTIAFQNCDQGDE